MTIDAARLRAGVDAEPSTSAVTLPNNSGMGGNIES
jgi:hypothetical protein